MTFSMHGEPDYGLADIFVRTAKAFANTTYQSVYMLELSNFASKT